MKRVDLHALTYRRTYNCSGTLLEFMLDLLIFHLATFSCLRRTDAKLAKSSGPSELPDSVFVCFLTDNWIVFLREEYSPL
jgi:hypothetical protein